MPAPIPPRPRRRLFVGTGVLLCLLCLLGVSGCATGTPAPAAPRAATESAAQPVSLEPTLETYRTVDGRSLTAHVFAPRRENDGSPAGAVLLFHGGGWSVGTPEWTYTAARRFAEHGLVAIPIEYRLSEGAVTPIEALADVCAAFRWARGHAGRLGIDPERVAGYGVSAGGHLVAATATVGCPAGADPAIDAEPDALLLWSPALDLAHDGWFDRKLQGRASAESLSPAHHVRATTPPTSIVHGAADTLTPLSGARRYCDRLEELGRRCDLHVYPGLGHLLTRNLEYQEGDFDPDPEAVAAGVKEHLGFLRETGFLGRTS